MVRCVVFLSGWLLALSALGMTPEIGKGALRKLLKLPTVNFDSAWTFDAERGFTVGSSQADVSAEISRLRKKLKHDVSDAEIELRLGDLYASINDFASAQKACNRAVECFRRRVEMQPGDPSLLTGLGRALQGAGKPQEAESVLRKAVAISPEDYKCCVVLGRFLDADARRNLDYNAGPFTSEKVTLARRELDEAGECFDKAAALAPEVGQIYFRRGMHRSLGAVLFNRIRLSRDGQLDDTPSDNRQFSEAALEDLQHASRLNPSDYRLIGGSVLFEIYTVTSRDGRMNWAEFSWNSLPAKSQRSIREAESRLENLGLDSDPHEAAGALEILGILQGPVLHEPRSCIATMRRVIALDPSREQAWDVLSSSLAQLQRYDELLAVCEERVHEKESARSHLLLAKALEKKRDWGASESEILESLRLAPNSFTGNLAEAALVLRRGQDADALMDANGWITRSERLLGELPPQQRTRQMVIELSLTRSIYFALTDQLDAARQWAKAVIAQDKNNGVAQEILTAMDY